MLFKNCARYGPRLRFHYYEITIPIERSFLILPLGACWLGLHVELWELSPRTHTFLHIVLTLIAS